MNFNDTSKVKAFILIDKINAHKDYLEKTSTLDPEPNKTALQENLKNVSILLSVIGAANICTTQWAVQTELYPEICKHFLKSLSSEIYFSAFLQEYKVRPLSRLALRQPPAATAPSSYPALRQSSPRPRSFWRTRAHGAPG